MMNLTHSLLIVFVVAAVTILLRALPFFLFSKKTPSAILYLGEVLPYAGIAMLVVYALKDTSFLGSTHALPEILGVLFVLFLHKWKHNTLLSILCGTLFYMVLVQYIFV